VNTSEHPSSLKYIEIPANRFSGNSQFLRGNSGVDATLIAGPFDEL
jgi:hypothetical protein